VNVILIAFRGLTEASRFFFQHATQSKMKEIALEMSGKSSQIVMSAGANEIDVIAGELAEGSF
jgi:acyl-CoA reductase-like NAD-dependent aldehyde dehydrogenase